MKTITVTSQAELDALPDSFKDRTIIEIMANEHITIRKPYGNCTVFAYDSSKVSAHGSSKVSAWDSSKVVAYDSSKVSAYGSSTIVAKGSSTIVAYGLSEVSAHGSSKVFAHDSSKVSAHASSKVSAYGSSTIVAHGSSTIVACGLSEVSAYGSSKVFAHDSSKVSAHASSKVSAYGSSMVFARDLSKIFAYLESVIEVFSELATIAELRDSSVAIYRCEDAPPPKSKDPTARVLPYKRPVVPSFETWLKRGFVVADGMVKRLVNQKTVGNVTVFEVTNDFGDEKSFVAKVGDKFAHGETVESAIADLRYKIGDRDKSKYESWSMDTKVPVDEMIEAYMTITGACSFGTKQFCESIKLKDSYTPREIIDLTKGRYGNDEFRGFMEMRGEDPGQY